MIRKLKFNEEFLEVIPGNNTLGKKWKYSKQAQSFKDKYGFYKSKEYY